MPAEFEIGSVAVITVWAEDVTAASDFYRDVLGLTPIRDEDPTHAHMRRFHMKQGVLILLQGKPQSAANAVPPEFPLFAITVDDLDTAVARLAAHNVTMPRGVEGTGRNRWVMFHDPAGNLLELVQAH